MTVYCGRARCSSGLQHRYPCICSFVCLFVWLLAVVSQFLLLSLPLTVVPIASAVTVVPVNCFAALR